MSEITRDAFLQDVAKHEMRVLLDAQIDGVMPYRHLRFADPATGHQHFYLTCIPGRLVYSGDMGTFVFARTVDMFSFFRSGITPRGLEINEAYWHEKLEAVDRCDGSRTKGGKKYTTRFIWCLWAIVWGIQHYDARVRE